MPADPLVTNRPRVVADLALKYRLPAIYAFREFADAGGLLSYGPNNVDSYRRAADPRGQDPQGRQARPSCRWSSPSRSTWSINLKTAQALGLTIPPSVLQQATEVIQ